MSTPNNFQPFKVVIDPVLMATLKAQKAQIPHIRAEIAIAKSAGIDTAQLEADLTKAEQQANQILKAYGDR